MRRGWLVVTAVWAFHVVSPTVIVPHVRRVEVLGRTARIGSRAYRRHHCHEKQGE